MRLLFNSIIGELYKSSCDMRRRPIQTISGVATGFLIYFAIAKFSPSGVASNAALVAAQFLIWMFMAGTVLATVKETIDDIQSKTLGRLVVSPSRYFRRVIAKFIANSVLTSISCGLILLILNGGHATQLIPSTAALAWALLFVAQCLALSMLMGAIAISSKSHQFTQLFAIIVYFGLMLAPVALKLDAFTLHFPIAGAVQAAAGNGGPPTALGVVGTACMLTISYAIAHMAIRRLKSNGGLLHT